MSLFIKFCILYFINLLLDYPLQSFLKDWKCEPTWLGEFSLVIHCLMWSLGVYIACYFLGLGEIWKLFMLLIGHYAIDYWKCHRLYKSWGWYKINDYRALSIDQALHFIQILLCLI